MRLRDETQTILYHVQQSQRLIGCSEWASNCQPGASCTGICFAIDMFQYYIVLTVILVLGLGLGLGVWYYFMTAKLCRTLAH